jgi:hypothetical protein
MNHVLFLAALVLSFMACCKAGDVKTAFLELSISVATITERGIGGDIGEDAVTKLQRAMQLLECMSPMITAPEAERAVEQVARSLRQMKIGADEQTVHLIDAALRRADGALEVVIDLGRNVLTGLQLVGVTPTLALAESVRNMWRQMIYRLIAPIICVVVWLLVPTIAEEFKSYRLPRVALALIGVACLLCIHGFPEETISSSDPSEVAGALVPSADRTLAMILADQNEILRRQLECVQNVRPILVALPDGHFRASSSWDNNWIPSRSKVTSTTGWHPGTETAYHDQFVEVALGGNYTVSEFDIHTRGDGVDQFMHKFQVLYKADPSTPYQLLCPFGSVDCRFTGPRAANTFSNHRAFEPFTASMVRIEPRDYRGAPAFRWELYGCKRGQHIELVDEGTGLPEIAF